MSGDEWDCKLPGCRVLGRHRHVLDDAPAAPSGDVVERLLAEACPHGCAGAGTACGRWPNYPHEEFSCHARIRAALERK